jgi:hypothetical protein
MYFRALQDLPWETVKVGCRRALSQCRFLPKPVEIRELAGGPVESAEDRTERAWLAWRNAARAVGSYKSLVIQESALAMTLVAMFGGWPQACTAEFSAEMWAAKRKEFGRVYRVMQSRETGGPVRLPGHHERTNALTVGASDSTLLNASEAPLLALSGEIDWHPGAQALSSRLEEGTPAGRNGADDDWQRLTAGRAEALRDRRTE